MIEKYENCPDCNKALDQAEYDGQYCRSCGTEPFGFQKTAKRKAKPVVSRLRLESLVTMLECELQRIDDDCGNQPDYGDGGYSFNVQSAWWKRRDQAVAESRQRLECEGARFTVGSGHTYVISLAGIRASSTGGYTGSYHNWLRAARAKLEQGKAA